MQLLQRSASEYYIKQQTMLALIFLGLVACQSASLFKFNRVTENHDRVIYYPNIQPNNNYGYKLVTLNEQKKNINIQKKYLDINIENIDRQKEDLDREIETIDRRKEFFDREIEKLYRQKDNLDRETDIINNKIDNYDRSIDYLNIQRDQLDNEIEKIDLEVEGYNIDSDRDRYNLHRAAVEDNEYMITINLPGYNENEIVVKSGRGRLVVQALHDILGDPKRSFQNSRSLPNFVNENGSWSYKWGVLRVVFPIIQRTRYETNNVVYGNGVLGKGDLEKKYTTKISSKGKPTVPTTYVSKYDVKATTQVTSQGNDIDTNIVSKSEEGDSTTYSTNQKEGIEITTKVEPTTYSSSQKNKIETTTNLKPISQRSDLETTVSVSKHDDDLKVTTSIPTYLPKQVDDTVTSIYIPDLEATTYSVTANDDTFLLPVVY